MPQQSSRSARIEARITPDALLVVRRAAELQGRSISDFVVAAAQEEKGRKRGRTHFSPADPSPIRQTPATLSYGTRRAHGTSVRRSSEKGQTHFPLF